MFTRLFLTKTMRVKIGYRAGLVLSALLSACASEPPPAAPPPPVLKFDSRSFSDKVEINIEGLESKPQMEISLSLVDVPDAPKSPDAELRRNLRRFLREQFYEGKEPADYAQGIIQDYRIRYDAEKEALLENPDLPTAPMNWTYTETITAEPLPQGLKGKIFRRTRYSFDGGAHGLEEQQYFVTDEAGAQPLSLDYFIQQGKEEALNSLVSAELRGRGIGGLKDTVTVPAANFTFNDEGIAFYWNPYEIAPYSEGGITVMVPYGGLQALLTAPGIAFIGQAEEAE